MSELVARHARPLAADLLAHLPGVVIEGARQVGKSTLAGQLAQGSEAVTVNLDREAARAAAQADPEGFVGQAGERLLVIDEIQRVPELTLAVKAAIDADRRPGRFLMTGSATLLRTRGLADSLAGRVARVQLYGLSRGEVTGRRDDLAHALLGGTRTVTDHRAALTRDDYAALVAGGSYPELLMLPERLRTRWVDDYVQAIVGRDLTELRKEVRPARSLALLRALAGNQAGELVKARVGQVTSIPATTIAGYLDLLHDVGLVASVPPWTPNLVKREVGRPKSLVLDSAVATRLCRLTSAQLASLDYGETLGKLLEGFVVAELLKQRTWSAIDFELFHFRDRAGAEVDLVLELGDGRVLALEVKASTSFTASQFKGLLRMRELLGDRLVAGVVLNTGQVGYRYADQLYGLPISALWESSQVESSQREPSTDG